MGWKYPAFEGGPGLLHEAFGALQSGDPYPVKACVIYQQENAKTYRELFQKAGLSEVTLPVEKEKRHIYNQFVIRLKGRRDELREFLSNQGVGTEVYYPFPLHVQDCFKYLGYRPEEFQESLDAAATTLALPIYPELKREQLDLVVQKIKEFLAVRH